jgi:hypothetical protein
MFWKKRYGLEATKDDKTLSAIQLVPSAFPARCADVASACGFLSRPSRRI